MKKDGSRKHDVVIVGGGPAGSAAALYLLTEGVRPVILEKADFPRYHIGESMTGECGACVRSLGLEQRMTAEGHAVKLGVKVYGEGGKNAFWVPVAERTPDNELRLGRTWQVLRSNFDEMMLTAAIERGAELVPCEAVAPLVESDNRVAGIRFRTPQGALEDLKAEVVIDASGQAAFLSNKGVTSPVRRGDYDKQLAVFSQATGAIRDHGEHSGDTLIFYRNKNHWAWFIPLDDEVVSIGVVTPSDYFVSQGLSKPDFLRQELQTLNPELARRLPDLTFVEEVRTASNYSYRVEHFTGRGCLSIGDSHRFIDPIFSFGLFLGIKEAELASEAVVRHLSDGPADAANPFADYEALCDRGQNILQDLIDCFWDFPLAFQYMVHHAHKDDMIDCFAGRIHDERVANSEGVRAMRHLLTSRAAVGVTAQTGTEASRGGSHD